MKYLCLIYENETNWASYSKEQADSIMGEYFAFTEDIRKNGQWLGGEALQPTNTATTVRVRNGKVSTTDGPFAETKEVVGGYAMIEVATEAQAREIARQFMELHRVHWPSFECECEARPLDGQ